MPGACSGFKERTINSSSRSKGSNHSIASLINTPASSMRRLPLFENSQNVEMKPQANGMTLTRHRKSPSAAFPKKT
jgi:hypothetical protein